MKRKRRVLLGLMGAAAIAAAVVGLMSPHPEETATTSVRVGPLEVWSVYDGFLESRDEKNIISLLGGPATVVELAPDGAQVQQGDALVRFDSSQWERDHVRLERDYSLAQEELRLLNRVKLPLEVADLELKLGDLSRQYSNEVQTLTDSRELLQESLISEQEVKQQEVRADAARTQADAVVRQLDLTRTYLHPSLVEKARITLASVEEELNLARRQMSNCVVRAPSDGTVAYKSLNIGGEFRTVRVGDAVFRNQPFMTLSDMSNLVVRCDVPESELASVHGGCPVTIRPVSFPDLSLRGTLESVGSMAQTSSGRNGIQKVFKVVIRLDDRDARLRSGMSAQARVLSHSTSKAVLAPRAAVWWEGDQAWCNVARGSRIEKVRLTTGMANDTHFEVIAGLKPDDRVVVK